MALELPILLDSQVAQLSDLPLHVLLWLWGCGAVALELPILLEPQIKQLSDLPLQVLLWLCWDHGPGVAYFAGATGSTAQ